MYCYVCTEEIKENQDCVWIDGEVRPHYVHKKCVAKAQKPDAVLSSSTDLLGAARALLERLDLVHESPEYQGVWQMAAVHGMNYKGPTYKDELETLRAVLAST